MGGTDSVARKAMDGTISVCRVKPFSPGNDLVNKWWNASVSIRMVPLLPVSITIVRTMTMMTKIMIMTTNPHARMTQHSNGLIKKERKKIANGLPKRRSVMRNVSIMERSKEFLTFVDSRVTNVNSRYTSTRM